MGKNREKKNLKSPVKIGMGASCYFVIFCLDSIHIIAAEHIFVYPNTSIYAHILLYAYTVNV